MEIQKRPFFLMFFLLLSGKLGTPWWCTLKKWWWFLRDVFSLHFHLDLFGEESLSIFENHNRTSSSATTNEDMTFFGHILRQTKKNYLRHWRDTLQKLNIPIMAIFSHAGGTFSQGPIILLSPPFVSFQGGMFFLWWAFLGGFDVGKGNLTGFFPK